MNKIAILTFGSMVFLMLAACTPSASSQNLTGSIWLLNELNGAELIQGTTITAQFDDSGRVGGTSGCNNYNTTYEVDGENISISELMAATLCLSYQ